MHRYPAGSLSRVEASGPSNIVPFFGGRGVGMVFGVRIVIGTTQKGTTLEGLGKPYFEKLPHVPKVRGRARSKSSSRRFGGFGRLSSRKRCL